MATISLPRTTFEQISAACARVLARQQAIRLAKEELARLGARLATVPSSVIQLRANQLLRERPHLIEEAEARVARDPAKWLPKRALRTCITIR